MPSIIYTALREIETTGYSIAASDISAAASDDSFNSSGVTNLSGLNNNEWFTVAGFDSADNNGWFQASANSTSTKIAQDTTTALVTEAAGDSINIVGYVRGYGQSYTIDFDAQQLTKSRKTVRNVSEALSGMRENIRHRLEKHIDVKTTPFPAAQLPQWEELLASIDGGESFTFDPYGSSASPDDPQLYVLTSDSYTVERLGVSGNFYYSIAFSIRRQ